jgi:DNA polymerase-3 subunit delta'
VTEEARARAPRERYRLDRIEGQAEAFEAACRRGRLHHAWLLVGPSGVGKASFAYRAARRLLGAEEDAAFGPLGSSPDDPVCRLIASQAHPDLLVVERSDDKKVIPVEDARRLPEFFSKAPALGGHRVAIIDSVDDLNSNGANALLKTLEEPSAKGVLFLISHAPGRLLATIRSRCRVLSFRPWPTDAVMALLRTQTDLGDSEIERLADMAHGSPGRSLLIAAGGAVELDRAAQAIVAQGGALPPDQLGALAESFRGAEGSARFNLLFDRLADAVSRQARGSSGLQALRWAELWSRLSGVPGRVEGLNLDRADAFWGAVSAIAEAGRTP